MSRNNSQNGNRAEMISISVSPDFDEQDKIVITQPEVEDVKHNKEEEVENEIDNEKREPDTPPRGSAFLNPVFVSDEEDTMNPSMNPGKTKDTNNGFSNSDLDDHKNEKENVIGQFLTSLESTSAKFYSAHRVAIKQITNLVLFLLYNVYLGFAIRMNWRKTTSWCDGVKLLLLLTIFVYSIFLYYLFIKPFILLPLLKFFEPQLNRVKTVLSHRYSSRVIWSSVFTAMVIFLIWDSSDNRSRLISAGGLVILMALGYMFSAHPKKIIWNQVFWGVLLQFVLGLIVLRWKVGQDFFDCLGRKTKDFLSFTDSGSSFVFGYLVTGKLQGLPDQLPIFAFKVLSTIIFFSFIISILYYYGLMQRMVVIIGWLLQVTMGTTACESTNAAGNIFLGMTEAPLMIKPYLPLMTKSELHAVMTGGFATIAGSVLAAYINFGVNPSHLLSASVMSAPAALGFAKLFYPETEISQTKAKDIVVFEREDRNAIEAASNGASSACAIVANIAANLIAFLAGVHFLNSNLSWFGGLVGAEYLTFEWLLSQIFRPLAFIMGVNWDECGSVGKLIGLKTIVNEFVAYQELSLMKARRELSARAEAISVFALCGFSNIGSIGIMLGSLTTLAPSRKSDLANVAVRAMIAGSAACFTTACVAGALLDEGVRPTHL